MISVECCDMSNEETEAEMDGEEEDDDEIDPQKLLGTWLGELESLKLGLENGGSESVSTTLAVHPHTNYYPAEPRIDSYRFSMANLEDSQDGELDAILGELCDLENQFTREIFSSSKSHQRSSSSVSQSSGVSSLDPRLGSQAGSGLSSSHSNPRFSLHSRSSSIGGGVGSSSCGRAAYEDGSIISVASSATMDAKMNCHGGHSDTLVGGGSGVGGNHRTDSPDNDSAFSDTVSMLSSESSASSGTGNTGSDSGQRGSSALSRCENHSSLSNNVKHSNSLTSSPTRLNLFIKAFTADGSAKSLLVDEKMSVSFVTKLLVDKNHVNLDLRWSIVEQVPELYMERVFEDHENLVDNLLLWTRDSSNKLLFLERSDKYDLFVNPELYLLSEVDSKAIKEADYDDDSRNVLIEEFFSGSGVCVPEVEGHLYLKCDGKKVWKKHYFVLRSSGLYYCPKGKSKLSKDLMCLVTFDDNQVYIGFGWKKKYKAPTEWGFGIKHPQVQTKTSKYIKYLCADDEKSLRHWITGIRIAKYGRQLLENYRTLLQDMAEDDLETLAHSRSFSMASVVRSNANSQCTTPCSGPTTPTLDDLSLTGSASATPVSTLDRSWSRRTLSRQDSMRSSSTNSDNRPNSASGSYTPTSDQYGFDSDFPTGTIKKKPSVTPKIPLTNTTRTLAKQSLIENETERITNDGEQPQPLCRNGPLRTTLRRSLTDEKISVNEMISTLRRQKQQARKEIPVMEGTNGCDEEQKVQAAVPCEPVDVDCLPLPPPPEFAVSMESLCNIDSLPPPPPEAYNGHDVVDANGTEEASPTKSKAMPPPVPPPKPTPKAQPVAGGNEVEQSSTKSLLKSSGASHDEVDSKNVKSPPVLRKIVFRDEVGPRAKKKSGLIPPPPPLPKQVNFATEALRPRAATLRAPQPPRRSESTRLSCRNYNSVTSGTRNPLTPPHTFLADLQRVMEKKWKVAQQLKLDGEGNAHEVMGFRDPPNPADVLCCTTHVDENKKRAELNLLMALTSDVSNNSPNAESNIYNTVNVIYERGCEKSQCKKRLPPPPPPKRSETTQLSCRT
ncbi:hypothetical protein CHUAL_003069 [Chamberlinius hualienensis]